MTSERVYRLEGVNRCFGSGTATRLALADITLTIGTRERIAIVGPSGCGKTTLLHILALLDGDFTGAATFGGRDLRALHDKERAQMRLSQIGLVFQAFHLLPELTLRENVALPHWRLHGDRRAAFEQADSVLQSLGMRLDGDRKPAFVSGGQLQRAAIARAVVNNPAVVLADEPTGNLDSANANRVIDLLSAIHEQGRTVIVVTHDLDVVRTSQLTLTMRDGRVTHE